MDGADDTTALLDARIDDATHCAVCRREVLIGESLSTFRDERANRVTHACDLCRGRAVARGWSMLGEREPRRTRRLRVELLPPAPAPVEEPAQPPVDESEQREPLAPELAIVQRMAGEQGPGVDASPELLDGIRRQNAELARLRRELDPARRAEQHRVMTRQAAEIRELRAALTEREARIERLQHARHAETSPMRMSRYALDAFNQSDELDRMARIARTLGAPTVNVHDEGPGIPRRVRLTLVWDIAWYEFVVKLDLGANKASVHETGTGGDPASLPLERRRGNAEWRDSGIVI